MPEGLCPAQTSIGIGDSSGWARRGAAPELAASPRAKETSGCCGDLRDVGAKCLARGMRSERGAGFRSAGRAGASRLRQRPLGLDGHAAAGFVSNELVVDSEPAGAYRFECSTAMRRGCQATAVAPTAPSCASTLCPLASKTCTCASSKARRASVPRAICGCPSSTMRTFPAPSAVA